MRLALACVMALAAMSVNADERTDKIRSLMEAQGLVSMFDQEIQLGKENGRKQADQMIAQIMASLNVNKDYNAKLKAAANDFIVALQPPWTAQDVVDEWATIYGAHFTDAELDQLLAFYTSALAQKEVVVSREALMPFTQHFEELYKPVMERETKKLVERLQQIEEECRCKKK